MTDKDQIEKLVSNASNPGYLQGAQAHAAQKLLDYDGEIYPHDGCAITLSVLLQDAGIDVPDTFAAIEMGRLLRGRGWTVVDGGSQQPGDVGSTCGDTPHHGFDHVYLVLKNRNGDEMVIADNREPNPHFRFASGKGRTPTRFFLRAS